MTNSLLQSLQHGLIVSCQAYPPNPFAGPHFMAAFAQAATMAGAVGLRVNGADDVAAVHAASPLPIIGIVKEQTDGFPVYITPSLAAARAVVDAGAQIVAIDATHRPRASGATPEALIRAIRQELSVLVMADVDTLEEGRLAARFTKVEPRDYARVMAVQAMSIADGLSETETTTLMMEAAHG